MRVALDPDLFARIDALYRERDRLALTPTQLRLLERHHLRLVRSGARLDGAGKARMAAISERLATLHTLFGQNVLHDEDEWRLALGQSELDGLPEFARSAAAAAASERGLDGKYVITLARASVEPFLTFSARRELRQAACEAWAARGAHPGAHDNAPLIGEILALRAEQARLLGYDNFAAYRLDDTMAKTPQAAEELLRQVWEPAKHKAAEERAELETAARADGLNQPLAPWDWRYYAEKVRQQKYALDEAELKPYFVLDNMVRAAFDTAGRLFGISFVERPDCPVYHPDVRAWEVRDRASRPIGLFLHDNFARPGKHSGAWMSSYREQHTLDGDVLPIIVNNNNFAKGDPTLLSFDDARTLFHEFGHGLHGLLSRVRYPSQSGTAVRRDFVEFPSQVFEHWLSVPQTLRHYARHYQTGEPLPEALLERLLAARNFNQGFATVEYAACAMLDLELHRSPDPGESTLRPSRRSLSRGSACRRRSGCGIARHISSTCSPAAATRPGITPICGPKCSTPMALPPSPTPAIRSIRRWRHASRRSTAPATRPTRWCSIAPSAVAIRRLHRSLNSEVSPPDLALVAHSAWWSRWCRRRNSRETGRCGSSIEPFQRERAAISARRSRGSTSTLPRSCACRYQYTA